MRKLLFAFVLVLASACVNAQDAEKPKQDSKPVLPLEKQLVETNNQIVLKTFKYDEQLHRELFLKALDIWAFGTQDKNIDIPTATEVATEGMLNLYPGVAEKLAEIVQNEKVDMEKRGDALHYLALSGDKRFFAIYKKMLATNNDAFKYESLGGLAILGDKESVGIISNSALAEKDGKIQNEAMTLIQLSKPLNEALDRKLPAAQRKKAIKKLRESGTATGKCVIEKITFTEPDLLK